MTTATPPATETKRPDSTTPPAQTAGCSKCGFSGPMPAEGWCPECGFYPKLGHCVDLGRGALPEPEKPIEPLEIPAWVWIMLAGCVAIVVASFTARFNVPEDGPRLFWSLAQLLIGLVVFLAAHVQTFIKSSSKIDDVGPADMVLRPLKIWQRTFRGLPEGNLRVRVAGWGITTALCAVFVVGGLNRKQLDELVVMFLPEQPHTAPAAQVRRALGGRPGDAESLEEAVEDLAGTADQFLMEEMAEEKPEMTCFIIGYTRSVSGEIRSLILADMQQGRPHQFVGKILVEDIDPSVVEHVEAMSPKLGTNRAPIPCPVRAYWLEAEIYCIVQYETQGEDHLLAEARVVSLETPGFSDEESEEEMAGDEDHPDEGDMDLSARRDAQATSSSSSSSSSS